MPGFPGYEKETLDDVNQFFWSAKRLETNFDRFEVKRAPQICLILQQFNLYVLLLCGKKIDDD